MIAGAELAMASAYYYRGEDIFDGTLNLQPTLWLGWAFERAELAAELWGAFPLHDRQRLRPVRDEVDLTLQATIAASERLELSAGLLLSFVPADGADPFTEALVGASLDLGAGFSVEVAAAVALESETGIHVQAGPAWTGALGSAFELELAATVGGSRYRGEDAAFTELALSAALTADLGAGFAASMSALYGYSPATRRQIPAVSVALARGW